jgi:hypothetical protein
LCLYQEFMKMFVFTHESYDSRGTNEKSFLADVSQE